MADTEVSMDTQNELNDLRMSDGAVPLYEHVKSFIKDVVNPMSEEFHRLGEGKTDIWSYAPGQLEALEKAKDEAKKQGLWNFFLPDAETGEGLKNLDYAYIAAELGKNPLASESMNCSAPDRQYGSSGARRHTRAERALVEAVAGRQDPLGLCHDRAGPAIV